MMAGRINQQKHVKRQDTRLWCELSSNRKSQAYEKIPKSFQVAQKKLKDLSLQFLQSQN